MALLPFANASSGNVTGPASSTDTAIALFNGTTGKLLRNSTVTIDTTGNIIAPALLTLSSTAANNTVGLSFATDTNLYRAAASILKTDHSLYVDGVSTRITNYMRVGSLSVPANTTAGDLTSARLVVGNTALATDRFVDVTGAMTTIGTGSNTFVMANITANLNQVSDQPAQLRVLNMSATTPTSNTTNFTSASGIIAGWFETRHQGQGSITQLIGVQASNFINGTNFTVANSSVVSNAFAFAAVPATVSANSPTGTVTNAIGYQVNNAGLGSGPLIVTNLRGVNLASLTMGTTQNVGIQIAHPALTTSIGTSTDNTAILIPASSVTIGNQTATLTNKHGISVGIATMTSTTNARAITNSSSIYIGGAPVASTNVTVTNGPYSLWVDAGTTRLDGNLDFSPSDSSNIVFGTTTGTKIGTATTQKIGFWNATPIVQPATGGAASTFVANTSAIANDTATWDSYTIGQVVKALRNAGILA